ncbi:MAG: hypothetical protein J7M25_07605 [Deltaproteobacteria bacterium]|nr:hypothetical protein [Deltaproteobacteria bacterium]
MIPIAWTTGSTFGAESAILGGMMSSKSKKTSAHGRNNRRSGPRRSRKTSDRDNAQTLKQQGRLRPDHL